MRYVISDIHGEYEKLAGLISRLEDDASEYIFLGDYSDKGGHTKETINFLTELSRGKKCVFLMGDHEYAWIEYLKGNNKFLQFIFNYGGISTLESYLGRKIDLAEAKVILNDRALLNSTLEIALNFFSKLKFYYEPDKQFVCVHAGLNPDNKGKMLDLHDREELVFIREKFIESRFFFQNNKRIVFGHTAFKEPYSDPYKIGIDTGAVYPEYGILTALNIDNNSFIQHNGKTGELIYA
jgi:serine/threonine protein phosphatase 1